MSTTELPKTYEPAAVELEANRVWLEEKCFQADPNAAGEPYSIVIPPPNVTGALHLGHAINNTLQDILTRMHRMAGFNTVWIPGLDHAGIATQAVVEKQLKEKENKTRHDVGRENLVERIWTWKQQFGDRILEQLKRLGCSCDWSRTRFTLDEQCAKAVRETFFKLFKDGLIYRGKRLVNWDVQLHTSISDDEIYHETVKTSLWHIRYPIVNAPTTGTLEPLVKEIEIPETGADLDSFSADPDSNLHLSNENAQGDAISSLPAFVTVATTRPETLLGDTAVAVHSEDPRWNWAIGKFVKLPLTDRLIPIIADDILVDPKFGSGVVKVTPAHDPNDYAVHQRHLGLADEIEILNILNPDGTLNQNAGKYAGMKRDAARKKVVEDLTAQGLLAKEEPYETQVGHSDRSKTPVEPYLSDQWFVKMAPLAEPALEVVRDGTIKFFPERHAQQYLSWLGEKRDWPISRQLWWGHRIPVWKGQRNLAFGIGIPQSVGKTTVVPHAFAWAGIEIVFQARVEDGIEWLYLCVPPGNPSVEREIEQQGFVQDPDVLDTWFSSALWPHSTLGWPADTADLRKWYPTNVLMTGRDIITLWVARMVMLGMYNMGTKAGSTQQAAGRKETENAPSLLPSASRPLPASLGIPFQHVAINPTILDGKGERMSKSKGNGVDPVDIIDTHGADALRFTLTSMATETQDVRLPVKKDAQGRNASDKFDFGRNFCNKLWNAAKFAIANLNSPSLGNPGEGRGEGDLERRTTLDKSNHPHPNPLPDYRETGLADRWIISRFNRAVAEANTALSIYRFDQYAKICYDFFWRDFCDWYVEAIKPVLKDPQNAGATSQVLAAVLDGALRLMHPIIPFITETIWWRLNEVRPTRGLPNQLDCSPSKRLILASWPSTGPLDDSSEQTFASIQETIVAIRNLRNEYKIDPRKPVNVTISADGDAKKRIDDNRALVELLATCTLANVAANATPPANAARAIAAGSEIFVEGFIDPAMYKLRTAKQCETLKQNAAALRGRLANEAYAKKAPPHLVQQTRDELAAVEAEIAKLGCT
jgi:valyl-tRNA synthetase